MDITKLPETLTFSQVKALRAAFGHFYDQEDNTKFTDPSTGFIFKNVTEYVDYLYSPEIGIPKGTSVKNIGITLESWYETFSEAPEFSEPSITPAPKYVESNTLTPEQLAQLQKAEKIQKEKAAKAAAEAEENVREAIKKKQEIYELRKKAEEIKAALKDKKIYYKVEEAPVEENQQVEDLKQQASNDPKKFIENDASVQFSKNQILKDVAPEEANVLAKSAAVTTYDVLNNDSPLVRAAVIDQMTANPELLNKLVPGANQETFKYFASAMSEQELTRFTLANQFIDFSKIDGFKSLAGIKIQFSTVPQEGFSEFDLNQNIISPSIENLDTQSFLVDNIRDFGAGEIRSQILLTIGGHLDSYIARLPADSLLAKTYNSEVVQFGLSSLGLAKAAPWVAAEGSIFGKFIVGSGLGNVAGLIQAKTGINLGLKLLAKTSAETAVKAGAGIAAETAIGVAAAPETFGLSLLFAAVWEGVKIAGKKIWKTIKEKAPQVGKFLIVGLGALIGFGLGGLTGGIIGGLGSFAGYSFFSGGLSGVGASLSGLGSGMLGFFGALGGAFLGSIGTPLLVTFLGFPIMVALILFIINSGAFIVPPSNLTSLSKNQYINVEKTANPSGPFRNSDIPFSVEYTIKITAKKAPLSRIRLKYECRVFKDGTIPPCPKINGIIPSTTSDFTISPSNPYSFTYSVTYDSENYFDSLIVDTMTVTADVSGSGTQTTNGSASIIIGDPPTKCFKPIGNNWPPDYLANLQSAIVKITTDHPTFAAKVCSAGDIKIVFDPTVTNYWGFHAHTGDKDVILYSGGLGNQLNAEYILTHESTHHLSRIMPALYSSYLDYPGVGPICSYAATSEPSEAFAEAAALYGSEKPLTQFSRCSGTTGTFRNNYPNHWKFENDYIFR